MAKLYQSEWRGVQNEIPREHRRYRNHPSGTQSLSNYSRLIRMVSNNWRHTVPVRALSPLRGRHCMYSSTKANGTYPTFSGWVESIHTNPLVLGKNEKRHCIKGNNQSADWKKHKGGQLRSAFFPLHCAPRSQANFTCTTLNPTP